MEYLKALSDLAHKYGAKTVVDNTAATPYHQRPLSLGCDFVVHSSTKFLSGHGVVVGGVIVSRHVEFINFWGYMRSFITHHNNHSSALSKLYMEVGYY